jgi:heme exporter protein D
MNWGGWQAFIAMGGYAGFVWGSFGVTVLALALELTLLAARRRKLPRA